MPVNVVRTYAELESLVKTNYTEPDLTTLRKAYEVANTAHEKAVRLTGHPFITHPIAVAYKLAEMGLHVNVVIAGMLHDVVEDSDVTIEDVQAQFGDDIASLVNNMTKLKHNVKYSGAERYAENLQKMFLAMASDVRVVFMKFADRLHNLSTLYGQPKNKQERIEKLRELHYSALIKGFFFPLMSSSFAAIIRKGWSFDFSKTQVSLPLWKIQKEN